VLTSIRRA